MDEAALNSTFAAIEQAVSTVDIVVACAGFLPEVAPAAVADSGDWWRAFEVNVRGLFLTFRAWMPHKSNNKPSFIYVNAGRSHCLRESMFADLDLYSSAGAHFAPVPGLSGYSPSKTAAANLIAHLQVENPTLHVTNFHPGILETAVRSIIFPF